MRCESAIGTYTVQPNGHKRKIFGCWPSTSCNGESLG